MKTPTPSHREAVALFRLSVIGDLLARELTRGELVTELMTKAARRYRPPGQERTRRYHWKTLQRWYYEAKGDPVDGLMPQSRERGQALALSPEQREMLLAMRREHPSAAADLILGEAVRHAIVNDGQISVWTLRRLFEAEGERRLSLQPAQRGDVQRRRWRAAHPGDLWHGDVCHLVQGTEDGRRRKALVHGFMDDASRFVVALTAREQEREVDMLEVLCDALLRHAPPKTIYLDNGACYRGDVLALVCRRLGIRLIHAKPYSPEARGTKERFWRTMRQRCTDHLPANASLHEVNQALWAWLDTDYHRRPHAGLLGETPRRRYFDALRARPRSPLTPKVLARALEVELTRKVRKDATFSLDGTTYEVTGRHLAGKVITLCIDGLTGRLLRVTWKDQPVRFGVCDPVANRERRRPPAAPASEESGSTPFNPISAMLQNARKESNDE